MIQGNGVRAQAPPATRRLSRTRARNGRARSRVGYGSTLAAGRGEPLVEVGADVGDALDADREAHHGGPGAGGDLLRGRELAMRRRAGVQDERARVADIGEMREELDALDQPDARLVAALQAEGEDRARALGQVFPGELVVLARFEAGISDP